MSYQTIRKKLKEQNITQPAFSSSNKRKKFKKTTDWKKKDDEILKKVRSIEKEISTLGDERPVKMTIASLAKMIDEKQHLQRNLDRLPKTKEYIQHLIDDKESYDLKCIRWAAHYLKTHGEVLTKSRIRQLSLCRNYDEKFNKEIESFL